MLKECALLVVSALLSGCFNNTAALEPEAKSVQIVRESERPLHCKFLGKISGDSHASDEKEAREGAENELRNQAAALKGNFALAEAEHGSEVGTSTRRDYFIEGKALRCQTEAMEEASEKADEKASEQKEKDEADREQKEADQKLAEQKDKKKSKK